MNYITHNENETFELGKTLAHSAKTFLLFGALGAGKTALIRGICAGLGVPPEQIHSPTFAIVNEYHRGVKKGAPENFCEANVFGEKDEQWSGSIPSLRGSDRGICSDTVGDDAHVVPSSKPNIQPTTDYCQLTTIYHIDAYRLTSEDWLSGGFDEYLDNGICLIEWAENIPPMSGLHIKIEGSGDSPRCITIN